MTEFHFCYEPIERQNAARGDAYNESVIKRRLPPPISTARLGSPQKAMEHAWVWQS